MHSYANVRLFCSVNQNLKVLQTKDHGRFCLAKKNLSRKTEITTGKPYAFAFTRAASRRTCAWSLDSFDGPLQTGCPDCKEVWYEDESIQKLGFSFHHLECKAFQKIQVSKYNTSYKMLLKTMARAVIRKALENGLNLLDSGIPVKKTRQKWLQQTEFPHWLKDEQSWKDLEDLVSNREAYGNRKFQERVRMAEDLISFLPSPIIQKAFPENPDKQALSEYLAECICRYECNCFGYFNPKTGDQIGAAVIPAISFLNHSCAPNAKTIYYLNGGPITVEASKDIAQNQEVNISYCDTSKGKKERQAYLKEYYHFNCACPKCTGKLKK